MSLLQMWRFLQINSLSIAKREKKEKQKADRSLVKINQFLRMARVSMVNNIPQQICCYAFFLFKTFS